jgi:hypothetical protein
VWVGLELVLGKAQHLKGIEVHEVEAAAPVHEGIGEPCCTDQRVNDEGKPPWLGDAIRVIRSVESDRRFRPAQVLWHRRAHRVDHPAGELEFVT